MIHHYLINDCGLNPVEVAEALKGWEIIPCKDGDEVVGEVMLRGSEIHVAFSRNYRGKGIFKRRDKVRAFFQSLLDQRKFLTTKSRPGDSTEPFIKKLGFVKVRTDKQFNYWWLDKAPFAKE